MLSHVLDQVFRREGGRVRATLIRQLGDFDLAEDAFQDAVARALERWPAEGIPANPAAWLTTVARRRSVDLVRRRRPHGPLPDLPAEPVDADEGPAARPARAHAPAPRPAGGPHRPGRRDRPAGGTGPLDLGPRRDPRRDGDPRRGPADAPTRPVSDPGGGGRPPRQRPDPGRHRL